METSTKASIGKKELGSILMRGGLLTFSLISVFLLILLPALPLIVGVLFSFAYFGSGIVTVIGLILYIYGLFTLGKLDKDQFIALATNWKVYAVVSLLLAEWSLANVPQVFLVFITNGPVVFGQAYIFPFSVTSDYKHITSSFPPIIVLELILFSPELNGNLLDGVIRFLGFGVVIFTLGYLLYLVMETVRSKNDIQVTYSPNLFWAELSFIILLVGLLLYEITVPIWIFFDPNRLNRYWYILKFLTPIITLFLLTFLLTDVFDVYKEALKIDPKNVEACHNKGMAIADLENDQEN